MLVPLDIIQLAIYQNNHKYCTLHYINHEIFHRLKTLESLYFVLNTIFIVLKIQTNLLYSVLKLNAFKQNLFGIKFPS